MKLARGHRIGAFALDEPLGRGGWGEVWAATEVATGAAITLKRLHPDHALLARPRLRFFREAAAGNLVDHPGVTRVHGVFESDEGVFIAFERLHGAGLDTLLRSETRLPTVVFVRLMAEVARALDAAHRVAVVHRDLKPGNVFVHRPAGTSTLVAKVLDFGVSKILFGDDGLRTQTSSFLGTPRYVSPEHVLSASRVDARSDLWAMGVILFEGLAGRYPHAGDTVVDLLRSIARDPPFELETFRADLPASLRAIVRRCLKPLPSRIPTAGELAAALESVVATTGLDPAQRLPERGSAPARESRPEGTDPVHEPLFPETLASVTELWSPRRGA